MPLDRILVASDFVFGCGSVGSRISYRKFRELFELAMRMGIHTFDNAPIYGKGVAQTCLNRAVLQSRNRYPVISSTKYGRELVVDPLTVAVLIKFGAFGKLAKLLTHRLSDCTYTGEDMKRSIETSREEMNKIAVDYFFYHSPEIDVLTAEHLEVLDKTIRPLFAKIGYSVPRRGDEKLILSGEVKFDVLQVTGDDFERNRGYPGFAGEIWVNQVIKKSRAEKKDWIEMCKTFKQINKNAKFIIGFNKVSLLNELQRAIKNEA